MSTEAGGRRARAAMARAVFDTMPSPDRALLEAAFRPQFAAAWKPDPGNRPQREAYRSKADLLLYGGAAGGGKTDLLLGLALMEHACSVIFRRAYGAFAESSGG